MAALTYAPATILRLTGTLHESGNPRSTLYRRIADGLFPKPIKIGPRAVGWPASEVAAVNAARIAGKTESEIRALVARLERNRQGGE